jgi:hypothetical protein
MAVTRIKNNQITDSTIFANNKVATGSIVGSLFASNLTMTSDVLITGNLQVQGSTSYSTLATTNTYINDPLIVLNNGATGTNSNDIGLVFELGDDTNQAVIWDESASAFAFASTTEAGTTEGNMAISAYADLQVKDLNLAGATASGDIAVNGGDLTTTATTFNLVNATATTLNVGGAASALNLGAATGNVTVADGLVVTDNLWGVDAYLTDLTATATVQGATITDGTASLASGSLTSAVNVTGSGTITGGTLTDGAFSVTSGAVTGVTTLATSGEATLASATISDLTSGRVVLAGTSGAVEDSTNLTFDGSTLSVTGDVSSSTLQTSGEATLASAIISDLTSTRVTFAGTSGALVDDADLTYTTASNTLAAGNITTAGTATVDTLTDGTATLTSGALSGVTTLATSGEATLATAIISDLTSGRVVLAGTAGAVEDDANFTFASDILSVANMDIDGTAGAVTIASTGTDEDIVIAPSGTGVIDVNGTAIVNLADPTADDEAVTLGYLNTALSSEVTNILADDTLVEINDDGVNPGNIGFVVDDAIVANLYATTGQFFSNTLFLDDGANVAVSGGATFYVGSTSEFDGAVSVDDTTTSTSSTTGALKVAGGVGVAENLNVGGTLDVTGATNLNDTTSSTNATTGALIVDGGVGVAENLNVGGDVIVTGDLTVNGTTTTVNSATLDVADLNITIADGAADSAAADGAGLTVDGASATILYTHATTSWDFNKPVKTTDTTDSTSPTTGALLSDGGLGVAKDVFIGGGDLGTDQTTFNLLNTTATTVNFAGAGTDVQIGAATGTTNVNNALDVDGDVNVDGGDITTNATTFNLVNATATTVNFAGAGTGITIGATTGTTTIQNAEVQIDGNLTVDGDLTITALDNTPIGATTASTGAFTTLDSTGTTTLGATSADSIDSTPIGASTASTGAFTTLGSSGEATLASAIVSDLTATRVTYAGASGALVDSANMTFDGTDLTVASAIVSDLTNNQVVIAGTSGALEGDANFTYDGTDLTVNSAIVGDLTSGRVVTAGTSGALEDDANFTWNGTTLAVTGAITASTTLGVTGESTLASAIVSDLTATRVTYAGTAGALVDSANMTFDGTDLTVASAKVSDLTATRVTYAGASGALVDSANMTFDGTDLTVASAIVSDLVAGRVTYAGTSGALTDEAGFEYNAGTDTLSVVNVDATQVDAGNLTLSGNNITGSNGEVVINDAGADVNFRVEGDTETNLLVVDAGGDSVLIGTATATADAALKIGTNDSIILPVGATGDRPAVAVAGMFRFNSTTNIIEFYNGTEWQSAQGSFTVIATQTFNGDDSTVAFTLSEAQTTASCIVSINGIVQLPTTAYGVSSTTLTFTEAPATGDVIEVRKLTTTTTVAQLADGASKVDVSASEGVDIVVDQTGVTVGASATTLDSFATSAYRLAKYVIIAENAGADEWETAEVMLVHDGSTATITTYGVVATGTDSWTYTADIDAGNVRLRVTGPEAGTTVKFQPTYIVA